MLVVGRAGGELLGLMLSSQHKRDGEPGWVAIGSGAWDREGRESFVRLDRVLEVAEHGIRREGAVLTAAGSSGWPTSCGAATAGADADARRARVRGVP